MDEWNMCQQNRLLEKLRKAENEAMQLREAASQYVRPLQVTEEHWPPSDIKAEIAPAGEGGLVFTLPVMLPRRLERDKARFLMQPMSDAFQLYQEARPGGAALKFRKCVLVYEHIYSRGRHRFIDHDNIELKHCQDMIEAFFLENDTSALCSAFQCSHRAEADCTRIWILPSQEFPHWLSEYRDLWLTA